MFVVFLNHLNSILNNYWCLYFLDVLIRLKPLYNLKIISDVLGGLKTLDNRKAISDVLRGLKSLNKGDYQLFPNINKNYVVLFTLFIYLYVCC